MKKKIINLLKLTAFTVLMASVLLLFKQNGWIGTLFLSTSIQFCIGSLLLGVFLLYLKKTRSATYSFIAAVLFSIQFLGYFFEPDPKTIEFEIYQPKLKVAQFNVLSSNSSKAITIKGIIASNADVVSIQETDKAWTDELKRSLKSNYPFTVYFPSKQCCFGISMISKQPLLNADVTFHGGVPNIEADIFFDGQLTHVISSHTSSPISRRNLKSRNQHLSALKNHVAKLDSPTIIIGDFNTVPWDENMITLKEDAHLIDSRKSYTSTFPSYLGYAGIPIDYILHTEEITCTKFNSIPIEGSDHMGIIGEYVIN